MIPTRGVVPSPRCAMETARRENYDSGEDFVLEYGELRFTFNEADFSQRCEKSASLKVKRSSPYSRTKSSPES